MAFSKFWSLLANLLLVTQAYRQPVGNHGAAPKEVLRFPDVTNAHFVCHIGHDTFFKWLAVVAGGW